jgi:hypothetical protein
MQSERNQPNEDAEIVDLSHRVF